MKNLLLLAALTAATSAQEECVYFDRSVYNSNCLKAPLLTVNTTIPFGPLFPTPPTFVYGATEVSKEVIQTALDIGEATGPPDYSGPAVRVAWWLPYDNSTLNYDRSQNRNYYIVSLETNSTNPIGGDAGGCTSLLGSECVRNLKAYFAEMAFNAEAVEVGMSYVAVHGSHIADRADARGMSCPEDLFVALNPLENVHEPLMIYADHNFAEIRSQGGGNPPLPPGNASFTHGLPRYRLRSMEEHKKRGLVAITMSWPIAESVNGQTLNYTADDVTVETACLRLGEPGGTSGGNGGGGENAASSYRVSGGLVIGVVGALLVLFQA